MKIAVLGSGRIGGALAKKWARAGHTITFGSRDPDKPELKELLKTLGGGATATNAGAAIHASEVVLFAIPGATMAESIIEHAKVLDGKILIDAANNMAGHTLNSFATFAEQTPKAQVFRAFNNYGWEDFENADFAGGPADLFYCGPDGSARATVEHLIQEVGLNPLYIGGVEHVDLVDAVLRLWITLIRERNMGRHLAFKVLTDAPSSQAG